MDIEPLWSALMLSAQLVTGACFLFSGVVKLRDVGDTARTFSALGVPAALDRPFFHRAYPFAELAIALVILAGPAWLWWLAGLAAAMLLATLTALVIRVVRTGDELSCNCFGRVEPISRRTVTRNVILTAVAIVALIWPPFAASALWSVAPAVAFSAVLTGGLAVLLTTLSTGAARDGADDGELEVIDVTDLPRDLSVRDADNRTVTIFDLLGGAPTMLVHVKRGCSSCEAVLARFSDKDLIGGRVVVRIVEASAPQPGVAPIGLYDVNATAMRELGLRATPSALLIAADGSIPVPPARGDAAIFEFVEGLERAVQVAADPAAAASRYIS